MKPKYQFTITEDMIKRGSKSQDYKPGQFQKLFGAIGLPRAYDIGKRVYLVDDDAAGFYQVENNEQRDRRLQAEQEQ